MQVTALKAIAPKAQFDLGQKTFCVKYFSHEPSTISEQVLAKVPVGQTLSQGS
jgi:hypothetical protein